jgi:V/A-type H+/Na+-transporting ATPase subunit I
MLRPVPMVHFRVQVPNRDAALATRAIAAEGLLHLVDIAHGHAPFDASPPGVRELYAAFRDIVHRIHATADRLGLRREEATGAINGGINDDEIADFAAESERILLVLEPMEKRVQELVRRGSEARERLTSMRESAADAERMRGAGIDTGRLLPLRFACVRLGVAPAETLSAIVTMLSPASHAVIPLEEREDSVLFAVAVPADAHARVDEALRLTSTKLVAFPRTAADRDPERLGSELAEAERAAAEVQQALDEERIASRQSLEGIARRAETAMLLLQAQTFFAAAGRFIVISGWVPRDSADRLTQRVRTATKGHAVIEVEPAEGVPGVSEGTLRVPILHHNPLLLRPFEKLINIYGTPSYEEVEPTAFFAIGFLLMFGLMFGDAGHGAVLFSAGWFLFRYMPRFLDYGILLMEAGVASAAFGLLYGSVFGIRGLIPTLWMEPIDNLPHFMLIAVAFGVVVVTGGLVLNIVNSWRSGDWKAALYGPRGVTGAMLYWVVLVVLARAFVPATVRIPGFVVAAVVLAAILVIAGARPLMRILGRDAERRPRPAVRATPWFLHALEASVELVDTLFSFFANTISFVRIAAFAAVHAGVFIAIFALADTIAALRFGGVLSIVVHVAGNVLVILLEGLTVSVQVLRLEYYEFFGKFFRGGGEPFAPLTLRTGSERHA